MQARALLSAAITLIYVRILTDPSRRTRRMVGMLGLMTAVTTTDYALSQRFEDAAAES